MALTTTTDINGTSISYESDDLLTFGASQFIFDVNTKTLYGKGDNAYGKLGVDSSVTTVSGWTPIYKNTNATSITDIMNRPVDTKINRDFFIFKIKGILYFSGKFGSKTYKEITLLDTVLKNTYPLNGLKNDNFYNKTCSKKLIRNKLIPILKINEVGSFFTLKMCTEYDSFSLLIIDNRNDETDNSFVTYTDYAYIKNNLEFKFVNHKNEDNTNSIYLCINILDKEGEEYIQENLLYSVIEYSGFMDIEQVDEDITISDDDTILKEIELNTHILPYFGDENDTYTVELPSGNSKYEMIDINVNIDNCKSIVNDMNITSGEYEDYEIIPYEDDNYKGPQFLYQIFYNTGIPINKFIPFEGMIIKDGKEYLVSHVRISSGILNNNFGVVQFILSPENKFLDEDEMINEENSSSLYKSDRLFGITFYPIIDDGTGNLVYQEIDNIPNSMVTQEKSDSSLLPAVIQSLDGVIILNKDMIRTGYPIPFVSK